MGLKCKCSAFIGNLGQLVPAPKLGPTLRVSPLPIVRGGIKEGETMAEQKKTNEKDEQQTFDRQDVDALAKIVAGLKKDAEDAAQKGNKAAAKMYQMLVKQASPIVIRGYARLEREELARLNKQVNPPKYRLVRQKIDPSSANTPN